MSLELLEYLEKSKFGKYITSSVFEHNELTLIIKKDILIKLLTFLRDDKKCLFKMLISMCGVDYPERLERFEIIYNLLSLHYNQRIRLKIAADEKTFIPSINKIFSVSPWYEREIWDMYGIYFSNNSDLRRILTDYNFEGHPLRKDFPLTGYTEVRYDFNEKKVVNEPVVLTQEFRNFDFLSPWEGKANSALPGDEKASK